MRYVWPFALLAALVLLMVGGYWAYLARTVDTPYHEVWIGLNSPLPEPLRAWSCGAVHDRLGAEAGIAPYGCEGLWE